MHQYRALLAPFQYSRRTGIAGNFFHKFTVGLPSMHRHILSITIANCVIPHAHRFTTEAILVLLPQSSIFPCSAIGTTGQLCQVINLSNPILTSPEPVEYDPDFSGIDGCSHSIVAPPPKAPYARGGTPRRVRPNIELMA